MLTIRMAVNSATQSAVVQALTRTCCVFEGTASTGFTRLSNSSPSSCAGGLGELIVKLLKGMEPTTRVELVTCRLRNAHRHACRAETRVNSGLARAARYHLGALGSELRSKLRTNHIMPKWQNASYAVDYFLALYFRRPAE